MTERNQRLVWIDLETTGNQPEDEIIEIGAVITHLDDYTFQIADYTKVYRTSRSIADIDPFVRRMHETNGLWNEVYDAKEPARSLVSQQDFMNWLGGNGLLKDGIQMIIAGSGVAHFDRRYLDVVWPEFMKRIAYYSYDIGAVRRFLLSWGVITKVKLDDMSLDVDCKSHRALDDIKQHIKEAMYFKEMVSIGS